MACLRQAIAAMLTCLDLSSLLYLYEQTELKSESNKIILIQREAFGKARKVARLCTCFDV